MSDPDKPPSLAAHATLPLDLYKANVGLQLSISRLLQDSTHAWVNALGQWGGSDLEESSQQLQRMLQAASWQQLATLPVERLWRLVEVQAGQSEHFKQIAVQSQLDFANSLQQVLADWQKEVVAALDPGES